MSKIGIQPFCPFGFFGVMQTFSGPGSAMASRGQQAVVGMLGVLLLGAFLILLALYLWLTIGDLIVILRNYNFRRASRCRWSSCGFYQHDETDPQTAECRNPFVKKPFFDRRRRGGDQPGCRRSIQVREIEADRKPADDYLQEFMSFYSAFHTSKFLWRLVTMAGGISLWALAAIGLFDFIKIFF